MPDHLGFEVNHSVKKIRVAYRLHAYDLFLNLCMWGDSGDDDYDDDDFDDFDFNDFRGNGNYPGYSSYPGYNSRR